MDNWREVSVFPKMRLPWITLGNQVIGGRRELAPLLGTAQGCWLFDKPCRIVADITGS